MSIKTCISIANENGDDIGLKLHIDMPYALRQGDELWLDQGLIIQLEDQLWDKIKDNLSWHSFDHALFGTKESRDDLSLEEYEWIITTYYNTADETLNVLLGTLGILWDYIALKKGDAERHLKNL